MQFPAFALNVVPGDMHRVSTTPEVCEIEVTFQINGTHFGKRTYRGSDKTWQNQDGVVVSDIIATLLSQAYKQFREDSPHFQVLGSRH